MHATSRILRDSYDYNTFTTLNTTSYTLLSFRTSDITNHFRRDFSTLPQLICTTLEPHLYACSIHKLTIRVSLSADCLARLAEPATNHYPEHASRKPTHRISACNRKPRGEPSLSRSSANHHCRPKHAPSFSMFSSGYRTLFMIALHTFGNALVHLRMHGFAILFTRLLWQLFTILRMHSSTVSRQNLPMYVSRARFRIASAHLAKHVASCALHRPFVISQRGLCEQVI